MRLGDLDALKQTFAEYGEKAKFTQGACQQLIDNAPTVEEVSIVEFKEPLPLVKAQKIVKALSKRPQGEWISTKAKRIFSCSRCDNYLDFDHVNYGRGSANFCPNCGAEMKGGAK